MKAFACFVLLSLSAVAVAQDVHVNSGKNTVVLSVNAEKPYEPVSGEKKMPVLSVQCVQKGKKAGHIVTFSPGGSVTEDAPGAQQASFTMTISGAKHATTWAALGDTVSFAYFGKQEPERIQFIQTLLDSGVVSIEFTPFLTGQPVTSTFDLTKLRAEMANHPECTMK